MSAIVDTPRLRPLARWQVASLEPNKHNVRLFPDSLSEGQIALLAQDFEKHGQKEPIEITPSGTVVNGERRLRAAKLLRWTQIDVVVGEELTDEQILDHVIDACVSARQMTLREQTNIYIAVVASLSKEAGVPRGRPARKRSPDGDLFVRAPDIKKIAAAKARFSSVKLAERAEAVFTRAPQDVQDQLCSGELTINAAYDLVPKRSKKATTSEGLSADPTETRAEAKAESGEVAPERRNVLDNPFETMAASPGTPAEVPPPIPPQRDEQNDARPEDVADEAPAADEQRPEQPDTGKEARAPSDDVCDEPSARESERPVSSRATNNGGSDSEEGSEPSRKRKAAKQRAARGRVDEAVDTLYDHIRALAEEDRSAARAFALVVMRRMKELISVPG